MRVLVTGGAGYIGSHTVTLLLEAGYFVTILDNFANSSRDVPDRLASLTGRSINHVDVDITDRQAVVNALKAASPDAVIHFAGLKSVVEAVENPLEYYRVNVGGSLALFQAMQAVGCDRLVFSSSATVYGTPTQIPIPEAHPLAPANPYGHSKQMVERIVEDWGQSSAEFSAVNLRYFNPVGAHPSARIGEAPHGPVNNLMPIVAQVAAGEREEVTIFGDDWPTPDGTGVRDYVHVMDLAAAHLAALDLTRRKTGLQTLNIGTGQGCSVLEMVAMFEKVSGRPVPHRIVPRRAGDVAVSVADPTLAKASLGWQATHDIERMCADAWAWQCAMSDRM